MTPSNNPNGEPLIYRIADALGVFHLVAPVKHTHTYAEVPGLADDLSELWAGVNEKASQEAMTEALAAKQDALTFDSTPTANSTNPVTSGGVKTALDAKQNTLTFDTTPTENSTNPVTSGGVKAALDGKTGISNGNNGFVEILNNGQVQVIGDQSVYIGISDMDGVSVTLDNIANLQRALLNPDSTPTTNSTNLVTSGGVKAALDGKQDALTFDSTPTANSTNPVTSGGVKAALDNKTSLSHADISSEVGILIKHQGDDEYDQAEVIGKDRIVFGVGENASDGSAIINASNIANLQRALTNPDSTPTTNSTNLVTSGGVKNAIDNAIAIRYSSAQSTAKPLIEDIFDDANLQKVDCGILNSTGSEASITDLFSISVGQTLYLPDNAPTIPNGKMVLLHLYRTATQGYFMVSIGGIYTVE